MDALLLMVPSLASVDSQRSFLASPPGGNRVWVNSQRSGAASPSSSPHAYSRQGLAMEAFCWNCKGFIPEDQLDEHGKICSGNITVDESFPEPVFASPGGGAVALIGKHASPPDLAKANALLNQLLQAIAAHLENYGRASGTSAACAPIVADLRAMRGLAEHAMALLPESDQRIMKRAEEGLADLNVVLRRLAVSGLSSAHLFQLGTRVHRAVEDKMSIVRRLGDHKAFAIPREPASYRPAQSSALPMWPFMLGTAPPLPTTHGPSAYPRELPLHFAPDLSTAQAKVPSAHCNWQQNQMMPAAAIPLRGCTPALAIANFGAEPTGKAQGASNVQIQCGGAKTPPMPCPPTAALKGNTGFHPDNARKLDNNQERAQAPEPESTAQGHNSKMYRNSSKESVASWGTCQERVATALEACSNMGASTPAPLVAANAAATAAAAAALGASVLKARRTARSESPPVRHRCLVNQPGQASPVVGPPSPSTARCESPVRHRCVVNQPGQTPPAAGPGHTPPVAGPPPPSTARCESPTVRHRCIVNGQGPPLQPTARCESPPVRQRCVVNGQISTSATGPSSLSSARCESPSGRHRCLVNPPGQTSPPVAGPLTPPQLGQRMPHTHGNGSGTPVASTSQADVPTTSRNSDNDQVQGLAIHHGDRIIMDRNCRSISPMKPVPNHSNAACHRASPGKHSAKLAPPLQEPVPAERATPAQRRCRSNSKVRVNPPMKYTSIQPKHATYTGNDSPYAPHSPCLPGRRPPEQGQQIASGLESPAPQSPIMSGRRNVAMGLRACPVAPTGKNASKVDSHAAVKGHKEKPHSAGPRLRLANWTAAVHSSRMESSTSHHSSRMESSMSQRDAPTSRTRLHSADAGARWARKHPPKAVEPPTDLPTSRTYLAETQVVDTHLLQLEVRKFEFDIQTSRTELPGSPRPTVVQSAESFKSSEPQQPESESMLSQVPSVTDIMNENRSYNHQAFMQTDSEEVAVPEPPPYFPPDVEKELMSSSNYVAHGPVVSPTNKGLAGTQRAVYKMEDSCSSSCSSSTESLAGPNAGETHHVSSTHDSGTQTTPRLEPRLPDAFRRMRDIELKFRTTLESFAKEGRHGSMQILDSPRRAAHAGG
eukprot:gnl/MRDRNA2_/MRDRNA2_133118_c0_seq1.p1 gnl/MRDRNA2_/MRDRNA2_133118_c0~~gnl/MRDRNA2_/MRDRNA2_133118_c0_seq1.p1  ORF type:complete len:1114 (+),score=192.37 gnl/MRDRNA2_/MRDRNA2_133118_c0_seq1:43-3384(+)